VLDVHSATVGVVPAVGAEVGDVPSVVEV
jgi:hypothetical protein